MKSIIDIIAEAMEDDVNANDFTKKDYEVNKLNTKCKSDPDHPCGNCYNCKKYNNKSKMCKEMTYFNRNKPCGKCYNCKLNK